MYQKARRVFLVAAVNTAILLLCVFSCCKVNRPTVPPASLSLITYNVQTFFDAVQDGTEFPEFKGTKTAWSEEKYRKRLERLRQTVYALNERLCGKPDRLPDVLVLQEIENDRVVEDFCKQLPSGENYPYAVCPPAGDGAPFTTALLSKYPIHGFFVHYINGGTQTALRPLLEVTVSSGTPNNERLLTIFAVHWKSKRNGADSQNLRRLQEEQLWYRLKKQQYEIPAVPYIVCGDFNQPPEDFVFLDREASCWDFSGYHHAVFEQLQPQGSYFFQDRWEKIDHILYSNTLKGFTLQTFHVLYDDRIMEGAAPYRFNVLTGEGYSDHLPLGAVFSFTKAKN